MRGEYRYDITHSAVVVGSPPHARGILTFSRNLYNRFGFTPAYAGNTACTDVVNRCDWDHPRMRGEYFWLRQKKLFYHGSPPHARGIYFLNCRNTTQIHYLVITWFEPVYYYTPLIILYANVYLSQKELEQGHSFPSSFPRTTLHSHIIEKSKNSSMWLLKTSYCCGLASC